MSDTESTPQSPQPSLVPVAVAIVFVGALIALSIYFVFRPTPAPTVGIGGTPITVEPVSDTDHILGNPAAPIKIIEYSDLDCPYCRTFHATMKQIMSVYGLDGRVAWVYRHFPIVELHPNAPKLAEAAECVAELSGNDAFWKFIDAIFTSPTPNGQFDITRLDAVAAIAGTPAQQFRECLDSGRHREKVNRHFAEARAAGGEGTPHNLILHPNGQPIPVPGAQPYATIKSILDTLLAN